MVIPLRGQTYGTAAELAQALGPDVTPRMIENWARRDGLAKITSRDDDGVLRTRYPLRDAAMIEARKRATRRGRPRLVDLRVPLAA